MKKMFSLVIGSFLWFVVFALGFLNVNAQYGNQDLGYNPGVPWSTAMKNDSLIVSVKVFINRVLWLLWLIALLVLLYGWFQMVTAAGDDGKYKKWFKILQQAGMWLIFIWLSWLFVSVIFWIINKIAWA
jgi:hypothetical protein